MLIKIANIIIEDGHMIFTVFDKAKEKKEGYHGETMNLSDVLRCGENNILYTEIWSYDDYGRSVSEEIKETNRIKEVVKLKKIQEAIEHSKIHKSFKYSVDVEELFRYDEITDEHVIIALLECDVKNNICKNPYGKEKMYKVVIPDFVSALDGEIFRRIRNSLKIVANNVKWMYGSADYNHKGEKVNGSLPMCFYKYRGRHLDLTEFNMSKIGNTTTMFSGCDRLKTIDFGEQKIPKECSTYAMIDSCPNIEKLIIKGFELSNNSDCILTRTYDVEYSKLFTVVVGRENRETVENIKLLSKLGYMIIEKDDKFELKLSRIKALSNDKQKVILLERA